MLIVFAGEVGSSVPGPWRLAAVGWLTSPPASVAGRRCSSARTSTGLVERPGRRAGGGGGAA